MTHLQHQHTLLYHHQIQNAHRHTHTHTHTSRPLALSRSDGKTEKAERIACPHTHNLLCKLLLQADKHTVFCPLSLSHTHFITTSRPSTINDTRCREQNAGPDPPAAQPAPPRCQEIKRMGEKKRKKGKHRRKLNEIKKKFPRRRAVQ